MVTRSSICFSLPPRDKTLTGIGALSLHLGSATPDTVPDHVFIDSHTNDYFRSNYAQHAYTGDINGDSYDDVFIEGVGQRTRNSRTTLNLEVYLGNAKAEFTAPDWDIREDKDWYFSRPTNLVNLNADCCAEIVYPNASDSSEPAFVWGRPPPPLKFSPDTVFPNPNKIQLRTCGAFTQVGDVDGDGYRDYFVS